MPTWVINGELARSSRPGYSGECGLLVSPQEVEAWVVEANAFGIKSIICLLSDDQLPLYNKVSDGLIEYYRAAGFTVEHVPAKDHQRPPLNADHLRKIWAAYCAVPKPVLVHCSAGVDRTGQAVTHIQQMLSDRT